MSDAADIPDDPAVLAGEYVLGVLDGEARAAFEAALPRDTALADWVAWWEVRLLPLLGGVAPGSPPAALWARIEAALPPAPASSGATIVTLRRVRLWQAATAASLAVAAALAALLVVRPGPPPATLAGTRVAELAPMAQGAAGFVAMASPTGDLVIRPAAALDVPTGRDLQLWSLPPGATRPVSLGVLPASGLTIRPSAMPPSGSKLLISLEPKGGSPTGLPTGPVLYGGTLAAPA